jgi:peroxiredoxin
MRTSVALAALLAVTAGLGLMARAARPGARPAPTGRPVSDFSLRDHRGRPHALADLAGRRLVVLVFLGNDCPLARASAPRLAELARAYGPRGVAFLGVNANAQDSLAGLGAFAREHALPFPLLKDPDHALADALGAERTPEAFVLDRRVVRYRGRIDDQHTVGARRGAPTRRDLAAALDELLAGRPVSQPVTRAAGCRIGRRPAVRPAGAVTYTRHVAPLLRRRCIECHRPGEAAPFPLTRYAEVTAWSAMIREVVAEGRMPPWFASPRHGRFRNDARLSAEEKQLLLAWIDAGCPEGDPADLAPAPAFATGWRIPRPDRVLAMSDRPFQVPAEGELSYEYFTVDPSFREDRYVRAAEVRPGAPGVVHHALVLLLRPGEEAPGDSLGALLDYAPGMAPLVLPEGHAVHVPAGSKFVFQLHYTPNGSPQQDLTRLGLVFADKAEVKKLVRGGAVINPAIDIAPGDPDYRLTAEQALTEDVRLLSLSPHMHLRGKSFRFEAAYPDGRREVLLDVPRYDFNWQLRYELAEPRRLPRGTRLVCVARYDNSADNPHNPDPSARVGWGDHTRDEMLIGFFAYVAD